MTRPDIIYIGSMKAGTTFLRSYFSYHPDIQWTRNAIYFLSADYNGNSETYLSSFSDVDMTRCIIDMYEGLSIGFVLNSDAAEMKRFVPDFRLNDPDIEPAIEKIALRIKNTLPHARILFTIRNQVNWLRSYYKHYILNLPPGKRKFTDMFNTFDGKCALHAGLFHQTIDIYFRIFGKENVLVTPIEAFRKNRALYLQRLCSFLEVTYLDFPDEQQRLNEGQSDGQRYLVRTLSSLKVPQQNIQFIARIMNPFKNSIYQLFTIDMLTKNEKAFIQAFYAVSNYHTSKLLNIDLGSYGYPL